MSNTDNYMFRPGLTIKARIVDRNTWRYVELQNVRPIGVNHRSVIVAGEYNNKTYFETMTALELTFLFPECEDRDKSIIQSRLWHDKPIICL